MKECGEAVRAAVQITFDLPQEAFNQIRLLDQNIFKELGIVSLHLEGDQVTEVKSSSSLIDAYNKKKSFRGSSQESNSENGGKGDDGGGGGGGGGNGEEESLNNTTNTTSSSSSSSSSSSNNNNRSGEARFRSSSTSNPLLLSLINPAYDRPVCTTMTYSGTSSSIRRHPLLMPPPQPPYVKKRQILINPNTGHLEPGPSESGSSSSAAATTAAAAAAAASSGSSENEILDSMDHSLKLKLKLPLDKVGCRETLPKVPKLILSMRDKTVKMAEDSQKEQNVGLQQVEYLDEGISGVKLKSSSSKKVVKDSVERLALWSKSLGIISSSTSSEFPRKSQIDDAALVDLDKKTAAAGLANSGDAHKKIIDNGRKNEMENKSSLYSPSSHSNAVEDPDLQRQLGEDSGIESMDALSEKSPNQGEHMYTNEELDTKEISRSQTKLNETKDHVVLENPHHYNGKKEESDFSCNSSTPDDSGTGSSSTIQSSPINVRSSSAAAAAAASSLRPGAKMVPVKLVAVSGEGNLRLVRVSPVKRTLENCIPSSRTVMIKSSILKTVTTSSSPSIIPQSANSTSLCSSISLTSDSKLVPPLCFIPVSETITSKCSPELGFRQGKLNNFPKIASESSNIITSNEQEQNLGADDLSDQKNPILNKRKLNSTDLLKKLDNFEHSFAKKQKQLEDNRTDVKKEISEEEANTTKSPEKSESKIVQGKYHPRNF